MVPDLPHLGFTSAVAPSTDDINYRRLERKPGRHRLPPSLAHLIIHAPTAQVESATEASGFLVVPLIFKITERCTAPLAGSIPVRLRHQR
jgi:hypothetical protein